MILIGLGSNLSSHDFGAPPTLLEIALIRLRDHGITITACSHWYASAPVPKADMPWFVNGVAALATAQPPKALLATLHQVETALGRRRRVRWESRVIDLDLLAYDDVVIPSLPAWHRASAAGDVDGLRLPHLRLHERAFVLRPLVEISPKWCHPVFAKTAADLLNAQKPAQTVIRL